MVLLGGKHPAWRSTFAIIRGRRFCEVVFVGTCGAGRRKQTV
jgi:hypothetical protein